MISLSGRQALAAMLALAQQRRGRFVPVRRLSRMIGASPHTLARIMLRLTAAGLTDALRGPGGGVRLARPAHEITLFEVVQEIDGPEVLNRCVLGLGTCDESEPCPLHLIWYPCRQQFRQLLTETTLADLIHRPSTLNQPKVPCT
ncbi:transcriptional regulator, BadM/Rrf2 family [Rhodothermus profundi]|uniref:Transcriptional regulator, BadM/Rrf2 family n=2 Tax=Rhodothermus profundi TaxID=633813 RepID=A0A1M6PQC9_9BACT|nr:transcriptional regulator, BadM/Rrf2 family [Rhodothermus profundi]